MASSDDDMCNFGAGTELRPTHDPLPAVRTAFGDTATTVYGWPSKGGLWVHERCYGIELEFLGLPRFETVASKRFSKEEDDFCKRIEWIGGTFYDNEEDFHYRFTEYYKASWKPEYWYGWPGAVPEGGLWALWTKMSDTEVLGASRIRNALTMEERCEAIRMIGGKFYAKWEDVKDGEAARPRQPVYL